MNCILANVLIITFLAKEQTQYGSIMGIHLCEVTEGDPYS